MSDPASKTTDSRDLIGHIRLLRCVVLQAIEWDGYDDHGVPAVWLEAAEQALEETKHD